eukprot:Pgem_evm1s18651
MGDSAKPIRIGNFVQVKGLQTIKYNNKYGIVRGKGSPDRNGNLRFPIHFFSSEIKEPLKIKKENIFITRDDPKWRIADLGCSILEMIAAEKQIREEEFCDQFVSKVWDQLAETPPLFHLLPDTWEEFLSHTCRSLCHISLMAAGFDFLLGRLNNDTWRLYQCSVKHDVKTGFTAGEWCCLRRPQSESNCIIKGLTTKNKAWEQYGGGKHLTKTNILELFEMIKNWQELVPQVLAKDLLEYVPGIKVELIEYTSGLKKTPPRFNEEVAAQRFLASRWAARVISRITLGGITAPDRVSQKYMDTIPIAVDGELVLQVSNASMKKCNEYMMRLTGESVSPVVFLRMLNCGCQWKYLYSPDGDALGFGMKVINIEMVGTYKEGVIANEKKKKKRRELLKQCMKEEEQ